MIEKKFENTVIINLLVIKSEVDGFWRGFGEFGGSCPCILREISSVLCLRLEFAQFLGGTQCGFLDDTFRPVVPVDHLICVIVGCRHLHITYRVMMYYKYFFFFSRNQHIDIMCIVLILVYIIMLGLSVCNLIQTNLPSWCWRLLTAQLRDVWWIHHETVALFHLKVTCFSQETKWNLWSNFINLRLCWRQHFI